MSKYGANKNSFWNPTVQLAFTTPSSLATRFRATYYPHSATVCTEKTMYAHAHLGIAARCM